MPDEAAEVERLRSLVAKLAGRAGLGDDEKMALDITASMMGVGRLPMKGIIGKRGPLTRRDRARMKEHSDMWADFAQQLAPLRELGVPRLLTTYAEHWDGSGKPKGLAGEDIPLGARVLNVCYNYNGMISDRSYRQALPAGKALDEIAQMSGTILDPRLAEMFVGMIEVERRSSRMRRVARDKKSTRRTGAPGKTPGKARKGRS